MSSRDNPMKPRSNEEDYFNRQNREAIERLKKQGDAKCDGKCGCDGKCDPAKCAGKKAAPGKDAGKGGCGCKS